MSTLKRDAKFLLAMAGVYAAVATGAIVAALFFAGALCWTAGISMTRCLL